MDEHLVLPARRPLFYFRPQGYGHFRSFEDLAGLLGAKFQSFSLPTDAPTMTSVYRRPYIVPDERARAAFEPALRALS